MIPRIKYFQLKRITAINWFKNSEDFILVYKLIDIILG